MSVAARSSTVPRPVSRRVVLWRHGRTAWNAAMRFQGQTDIPLDEVGVQQARAAAARLASLQPDLLVSSDLLRTRDTAAELARLTGLEVRLDPGLRETFAGTWQGRTSAEIAADDGDAYAAWVAGEPDVRPGGGETRWEVAERTCAAVHRALEGTPAGGTLVVVTHGGAARTALAMLLGLPPEHWGVLGGLSNCCWSVLHEDARRAPGAWRLEEHNAGSLPEPVLTEEG
ncbi:putative phosphoglycerate mutase [Motilibacter rhizosphaerae]|uniref:Putative phosphoglycerate mutase n=1 Tax=Motilibacter rhizosphaerae TaxID=598652 RepID=A0A4Q7NTN8_9ACTN|nr:histidine phosphatase family protein [Motilibacter rhizosphaerae]RZS89762.1 putative phosphoglycerate mutase [Motilibacter rhizosphaerae]